MFRGQFVDLTAWRTLVNVSCVNSLVDCRLRFILRRQIAVEVGLNCGYLPTAHSGFAEEFIFTFHLRQVWRRLFSFCPFVCQDNSKSCWRIFTQFLEGRDVWLATPDWILVVIQITNFYHCGTGTAQRYNFAGSAALAETCYLRLLLVNS